MQRTKFSVHASFEGIMSTEYNRGPFLSRNQAIAYANRLFDNDPDCRAVEVWRSDTGLFGTDHKRIYRQSVPW